SGRLTITGLQVHGSGGWHSATSLLGSPGAWAGLTVAESAISASTKGLNWTFTNIPGKIDPTIRAANTPARLPAGNPATLAAPCRLRGESRAPLSGGARYSFPGTGLNGAPLRMRPAAVLPAVPGAPGNGVLVDRRYAELAAGLDLTQVGQQVWLAAGAPPRIRH